MAGSCNDPVLFNGVGGTLLLFSNLLLYKLVTNVVRELDNLKLSSDNIKASELFINEVVAHLLIKDNRKGILCFTAALFIAPTHPFFGCFFLTENKTHFAI